MWKALAFKELRDVLPITCIALLAYLACAAYLMGYPILFGTSSNTNRYYVGIPFLDGVFLGSFTFVSIGFTIGLGLWQTLSESNRGTWLFLLHRPVGRRTILGVKLLTGLCVYLLASVISIIIYYLWAATPGTHASPFEWWMTWPVWRAWIMLPTCYLGAFLTGLRPGRWFGTRLLPLLAVGFGTLMSASPICPISPLVVMILFCAVLVFLIFSVACNRDFS